MFLEEIFSQFFSHTCDDSSRNILIENIFEQDQEKTFAETGNRICRTQDGF